MLTDAPFPEVTLMLIAVLFDLILYQSTTFYTYPECRSLCKTIKQMPIKIRIFLEKTEVHCGNRRTCWFPAFSRLSHCFPKLSVSTPLKLGFSGTGLKIRKC